MDNISENKRSPQLGKIKIKFGHTSTIAASDSDASIETNSLSADSTTEQNHTTQTLTSEKVRNKKSRRGSQWEILEGLKDGQRYDNKPNVLQGYLHKKRKWPLKGWHKRYFLIENGILVYGKGPSEVTKGKVHGSLDIGLSVISTKVKRRRIDIDAEEFIYHLKAKTEDVFKMWVQQLTGHRLYRQHVLTYGTNLGALFKATDTLHNLPCTPEMNSRDVSLSRHLKPANGTKTRLNSWLQESLTLLEQYQRDASAIDQNIAKLKRILHSIETTSVTNIEIANDTTSIKKDRRKFGLKKKKSSKGSSVDLNIQINASKGAGDNDNLSPVSMNSFTSLSTSPNIQFNTTNATLPLPIVSSNSTSGGDSLSNAEVLSLTETNQIRDGFISLASSVLSNLKTLLFDLTTERERLKTCLENEAHSNINYTVLGMRNNLNQALQQNSDLKSRLLKIHESSDLNDLSSLEHLSEMSRPYNCSLSYSSSCVSATEFFDAEDLPAEKGSTGVRLSVKKKDMQDEESEVRTRSESSSEVGSLSSGEGSVSSGSEIGTEMNAIANIDSGAQGLTGRRSVLPVPRASIKDLSLWNLLSRNIGKDLSQVSMPVALNEPLNVLQRLCEELEYSELLDRASTIDDPYERMVELAAFAVSAYANSLTRAGNKPFNPILGETYECIREDKGFKFISEQVSHHPPVSACYAESPNFTFWQDGRIKTKFWGKSMEFQPLGSVNVLLPRTGDLYTWEKVTTCVHNLFSGTKWVDQYGELKITNGRITCKLTFQKASYWSAKKHEIVGAVYDENGKPVRQLFGKWSEALYCGVAPSARCVWRAGTLPENHESYYGFTRFAIELNELGPDAQLLPPTDTRLRPDQRALEEGDLPTAESLKLQLETSQRERRKRREELGVEYEPRWFSSQTGDTWQYNGKYWESRKNPGFANMQFESLW